MWDRKTSRPAIFLDRDGTIIEHVHYLREPEKVRLFDFSVDALKTLRKKEYWIFVISNQSGVGRGLIKKDEFTAVHSKFCDLMKPHGVEIDEFLYCFHRPDDQCDCRKPRPGLIRRVAKTFSIDFQRSFTLGDSLCDVELAKDLDATGCLTLTGDGQKTQKLLEKNVLIYENILDFAKKVPYSNVL